MFFSERGHPKGATLAVQQAKETCQPYDSRQKKTTQFFFLLFFFLFLRLKSQRQIDMF